MARIKDIKGCEGLYAITEDGRVWSYLKSHKNEMQKTNDRELKHFLQLLHHG